MIDDFVEKMEKDPSFCELDYKITSCEIVKAIHKLKSGKAVGLDGMPNEIFKSCATIIAPLLQKLFNLILSSGIYPYKWSSAYICPIFKSKDPLNPENYRGIAINNCMGKLFNLILNNRLDKYLEKHKIINPCQIGFSKKCRTSDHIFIVKTLIDKYTSYKGGKLFTCFIDFKKAFDKVIHSGIKLKLLKQNITGLFYGVLKDMYNKSELSVKIGNYITPKFRSLIGVRQGDVLSPNLFKIFINDLPDIFEGISDPVNLNGRKIDCLMYADDIVIFSSSKSGLQKKLDQLYKYCEEWCLEVNLSKTQIVIFNKPGKFLKDNFKFNNETIECVNNYVYLGMKLTASGLFKQGKEEMYKKSMKAVYKLQRTVSSSNPSVNTYLHLYDHTVKPILMYGSEITGMFKTNSAACSREDEYLFQRIYTDDFLDKSHLRFLKNILGVNKKATNIAVLAETGRYPLYFSVVISMLKYWYRIKNMEKGLLKDALIANQKMYLEKTDCWLSSVNFILQNLDIKIFDMSLNSLIKFVKNKLCQSFLHFWNNIGIKDSK